MRRSTLFSSREGCAEEAFSSAFVCFSSGLFSVFISCLFSFASGDFCAADAGSVSFCAVGFCKEDSLGACFFPPPKSSVISKTGATFASGFIVKAPSFEIVSFFSGVFSSFFVSFISETTGVCTEEGFLFFFRRRRHGCLVFREFSFLFFGRGGRGNGVRQIGQIENGLLRKDFFRLILRLGERNGHFFGRARHQKLHGFGFSAPPLGRDTFGDRRFFYDVRRFFFRLFRLGLSAPFFGSGRFFFFLDGRRGFLLGRGRFRIFRFLKRRLFRRGFFCPETAPLFPFQIARESPRF